MGRREANNDKVTKLYEADRISPDFSEIGILGSYRYPSSSPLDCIKSLFRLHNETFNIWTHLISFGFYVWHTLHTAASIDLTQEASLPHLGLLITSCLFPLGSALAHTFSCMSETSRHICFMVDYFTISLYAYGACMANKAYAFPTSWKGTLFDEYFLVGNFVNCIGTVALSCQTRFMASGKRNKIFRLSAFFLPYAFGMLPCFQRALTHESADSELAQPLYYQHFIWMGICVLFYGSHCPERLLPGKFDVYGHSHQLFHVTVIWATYQHSCGITEDYMHQVSAVPRMSALQSIGSLLTLTIINGFTLIHFSNRMYNLKQSQLQNGKAQ